MVPTGFTSLILWCSSDYRKDLKAEIRNEPSFRFIYGDNEERLEQAVKREVKCRFIMDIIRSIPAILNFIQITYLFIVTPFSVLISDFFILIFLALQLGVMIYVFIANFNLIKSLCKGIKDVVNHNQKIQQTLNERSNKWKSTLKEIENKQKQYGTGTKQPKKILDSNTILLLPDDNLINKVENVSNNIVTSGTTSNLNSNINEENDSTNNELTTNTNKNLMTGDTSNISKTIQIQNQNLSRKNNLYNKIGTYGCPDELNLESAPESEEEI